MKFLTISTIVVFITTTLAADVEYSVIAFPGANQGVSVSVGGQVVPLKQSSVHSNIYTGVAPFGETYQYVLTDGSNNQPESTTRTLAPGTTSTGNEFFDRSKTVYDVPGFPQAYNPIYPTLFTNLNRSDEIATIIMTANATQLDAINAAPTTKLDDVLVSELVYITNKEVHKFSNSGLSTSGQSTKDFAKQSYAIDINGYVPKGSPKSFLYGRSALKLRAEETDATFAREKLVLDMLAAAGGATLSSSWVRVFINNEPYGLFLLMDDASTRLFDAILHGGNTDYPHTGVTYKGNALSETEEGNLVYLGDDVTLYPEDYYKLVDTGEYKEITKKNNSQKLIVEFTRRLSAVNPADAIDAKNPGSIANLIDSPQHTLIHMAINFLIGSWDGFWYQASNYYLNHDFGNNKWTLITYDFDETYGNGLDDETFSSVPYTSYGRPGAQRPLVSAFINNTYYDGLFQETVKTIVKRFFKPSIVIPRLEAISKMLEEDIAWTRTIAGRSQGLTTAHTVEDFKTGLIGNYSYSISNWVEQRVASLKTQLNFDDIDDLPALPAYTAGTTLDSNGNVIGFDGKIVTPAEKDTKPSTDNSGSKSGKDSSAGLITKAPIGLTVSALFITLMVL